MRAVLAGRERRAARFVAEQGVGRRGFVDDDGWEGGTAEMGVGVVDDWEGVMEGEVVVVDEAAGRGTGVVVSVGGVVVGLVVAEAVVMVVVVVLVVLVEEKEAEREVGGDCAGEVVVVVVEGLGGPESGSASASVSASGSASRAALRPSSKEKYRGCSGVSRGLRSGRCRGWCWWGCLVVPLAWLLPPLAGASSCPTLRTSISRDLSLPRSSVRHSATVSFPIPCQPLM